MNQLKNKVIFENGKSRIKVETDGHLIGLTSTIKGASDTTVYCYQEDLEKALEFVSKVKEQIS